MIGLIKAFFKAFLKAVPFKAQLLFEGLENKAYHVRMNDEFYCSRPRPLPSESLSAG